AVPSFPTRRSSDLRRHVVAAQEIVDPRPVLLWHEAAQLAAIEPSLLGAGELLGYEQVDPVGLALYLLLDPTEVDIELLGTVGDGAEHAAPAGIADRGDHVTTMTEAEDGDVDTDEIGCRCAHERAL